MEYGILMNFLDRYDIYIFILKINMIFTPKNICALILTIFDIKSYSLKTLFNKKYHTFKSKESTVVLFILFLWKFFLRDFVFFTDFVKRFFR